MIRSSYSLRAALRLIMLAIPASVLAGSTVGGPEIVISSTSQDFGAVPVAQGPGYEASFAIMNIGTEDLILDEIKLAGSDPDDFQIVNAPSLAPIPAGNYRMIKAIYAPRTIGSHQAKLEIKSSDADESKVEVTLSGQSTNIAPVAKDDTYFTPEDTGLYVDAPGFMANDYDPDGSPGGLIAAFVSKPVDATLGYAWSGEFYYIPAKDYNGPEDQVYLVHDGFSVSNMASLHIDVASVVDPPLLRLARSLTSGPTNLRAVAVAVDTPPMPDPPEVVDISESPTFDSFATVPYNGQTEATYTLTGAGDGERQLYVRLRNEGGASPAQTVTVLLDETAPAVDPANPLRISSSVSLDPSNVDILVAVGFTEPLFTVAGATPGVTNGDIELGGTVDTSGLIAGIAYPVGTKSAAPAPTYIHVTGSVPSSGILTVGLKANVLRDAAGNLLTPPAPASIALSSSVSDWQLLN